MRAFTLIEILVALSLLSLLIVGGVASAYVIAASSKHTAQTAWIESEKRFVSDTIAHAVRNGLVREPREDSTSKHLVVQETNGRVVKFHIVSGLLTLQTESEEMPLSTVPVSNITFTRTGDAGSAENPEHIDFQFSVSEDVSGSERVRTITRTLYLSPHEE